MAEARAQVMSRTWTDENPYYLIIAPQASTEPTTIDLGEQGWATKYAELMRVPGVWLLIPKSNNWPPMSVVVYEGEQPYYTARHIGVAGSGGGNEIVAYGIGKKLRDGNVMRIWALPNGMICGGDDVDDLGIKLLHVLGPR